MFSRTYSSTSGRAIEPSTASMNSSCRFSGSSARCLERPTARAKARGVGRLDRAPLQPDAVRRDLEAGALEPVARVADRGEVPGRRHAAQVVGEALVALQRLERPLPLGDVALAAALGLQHAARAAAPRTGARTAARGRGSSGRSRWRRSRRPARRARASSRSETISSTRSPSREVSRACSIIALEPSTPITRPSGRRSQDQPRHAARCRSRRRARVSSPRSVEPGEHLPAPLLLRARRPGGRSARPSRPARSLTAPW